MPLIDLCIDARMAFSAGIGTCIRKLAPLFNEPPFRTILLVSEKEMPWCREFEQIVCHAPIYSLQEQLLLPLKIPRCDLFWSPHYNIPLLSIRAKKRIATIHDACHLALKQLLSRHEICYAKFMMSRALHSSHATATVSLFSKRELIRFLGPPKEPLNVIYPAVDQTHFQKISDTQVLNKIRTNYQLPPRFALFVGNHKPHKNLHTLLRAFSTVSIPNLHLAIVGKQKGLRHSIEHIAMDRVLWLGEVANEDLPALYTLAELFVFPSLYEGFGLPPLEAMSCGCPTIVSHAASLPEVCGHASIYITPENHKALSEAIHNVASNPALKEQLVRKGYERAANFSWQETAQRYRELFEEVLRKY